MADSSRVVSLEEQIELWRSYLRRAPEPPAPDSPAEVLALEPTDRL